MKSKTSQDAKMIYNDKTRHFQSELTYLYLVKKKKKGKPKNTRVGSLSLLQQIFLTQESNQGVFTNWAIREAPIKKKKEGKWPTTSYSSPWDWQVWYRLNSIFVSFNTNNHRARRSPNTIPTFIISQKLWQRLMSI